MSEAEVRLSFTPKPHQREAHELRQRARFVALVWHRRCGKTVFSIMELVLSALSATRERSRYGYVCPYLKQSKAVAWDYLQAFAREIPGTIKNESELSVEFANGARIRLYGADNPDSFRGLYFDGVVLDEVADMRPEVWGTILRPALADRQGWAIFIGTPKGVNLFSELYYRSISGEAGWAGDMRRATETGMILPEELEQARKELSPSQFAQEFLCDFAAAVDDVLLRLDDVLDAQKRSLREADYTYAPKVLGVDVARYGDDRTVLALRQGLVAYKPRILRGADTMTTAAHVAEVVERQEPDGVFVDAGGVGAGVIDRLRQLGVSVIPVDFGGKALDQRFENKRAEMWWSLAEWVKAGACLPDLKELVSDLTAPKYTFANKRGRMQLESKDDLRARGLPSPDVGDALACTFAFPVVARGPRIPGQRQGDFAATDYNPYQETR